MPDNVMTYFFIFLLQTLLPTALLLGCSWSVHPRLRFKPLVWLALFGCISGIALGALLPVNQTANLILTGFMLCSLVLFYACQFIRSSRLNHIWHFILIAVAALQWAKDPNIAAITGTDVINTDAILHLSAVISGVIFCIFMASWLFILLRQYKIEQNPTALRVGIITLLTIFMIIPLAGEFLLALMKLQMLELTKGRLSFVAKSGGIDGYFNYLNSAILAVVILIFGIKICIPRKRQMHGETRPIEKRKKTASYRRATNLILWGLTGTVILFAGQLYWDKVASRPPQLSEAVAVTLDRHNQIHIPIEQVKDGGLHRFVWIADDGKAVRFFIINRQPDRLSLAAVFDACLLCGDQGYVMQDDQVICIGCGVRMFIPSIGKPGGCNPVPIENWRQTATEVVIEKRSLEDGLNLFSTVVEIEVTDPVNGAKLTNTKTEHKYSYDGKTYFFINEKNLALFRDNPDNYLQGEK